MGEFDWILDVEEPKVLGEEDVFDINQFRKIKYIYHILPSGKKTHFTDGGTQNSLIRLYHNSFFMGLIKQ